MSRVKHGPRHATGKVIGVSTVARDITERKRAEEALRASQQIIEEIINAIPVRVFWKDKNLVYLGCNAVFARDAGFADPKDIIGKDDYQMGWRDQAEKYRGDDRQVIESGCPKLFIEEPQTTPEGNTITLLSSKLPLRNSKGEISGILGTYMDITERKRLEAQLSQSQKMETVGKLAGGIAHEFNSILTAIIGQSELLLGDLPAGSPLAKNATEISKAAGRAATLTRQLLAYGRKQFLQPEALDLNRVIASMEAMFHHLMGVDVVTQIVTAAGLKAVRADAGQIEQVIMNMALNARDAMPNGGKLTLETANVSFGQESVGRDAELKPGDYVMLAITDTGAGMSAEVRAHVFEPFFTTKGVGQGTGLGLSTCYGIIKQSGGHISVYSEPARGTTFKIYLPQVEQQTKIPIQRFDSSDLPRGTETILLVEDDPALREMAATLLRRLGYTVLAADNGLEALRLTHQKSTGYIDLLFTDVVMPQMSGKELSDRIHALHPNTKILFTSAYTESAIVHQGALNPGVEILQKPFTPSALAHKVREVLDGKNGSGNESHPLRSEASDTPVCV
ncbi:MAG: response regulator [Verrucomicrobiia bacterium]